MVREARVKLAKIEPLKRQPRDYLRFEQVCTFGRARIARRAAQGIVHLRKLLPRGGLVPQLQGSCWLVP